jgi:hypothetical protein
MSEPDDGGGFVAAGFSSLKTRDVRFAPKGGHL